jgi:hypothetical protein
MHKSGIPEKWLKRLVHREMIEEFASGIYLINQSIIV